MNRSRLVVIVIVMLFIVAAIAFAINILHPSHISPIEEAAAAGNSEVNYRQAVALLKEGNPKEAITIIKKYRGVMEENSARGERWLDLFVRASVEAHEGKQLLHLYNFRPEIFYGNEEASLAIAEELVLAGKNEEYTRLRQNLKGNESNRSEWVRIDSDFLVLQGKRDEAITLLNEEKFEGNDEINRLISLAMLQIYDAPDNADKILSEALEIDPDNTKALAYRAKLRESMGKESEALSDYIAAYAGEPENAHLAEHVSDFFLKKEEYSQAIQIYEESIRSRELTGPLLLKALFWEKVIKPFPFDRRSVPVPSGVLQSANEYLLHLPSRVFWRETSFVRIPEHKKILENVQEVFWLKLIGALKKENLTEAENLLKNNPFRDVSYAANLEAALLNIIAYKKSGSLISDPTLFSSEKSPPFFEELERLVIARSENPDYTLPEETAELLKGPFAFSAAFLAAKWNEVALDLLNSTAIPETYPDWLAKDYVEAIRVNRGDTKALEFAGMQKKTSALNLITAQILLEQDEPESALAIVESLTADQSEIGMKAGRLLSLLYLSEEKFSEAKKIIADHPLLRSGLLGSELMARIALAEGELVKANLLYTSIEENSSEAKSFLARRAYADKKWDRARDLTIELLKSHPGSEILRQNLQKIIEFRRPEFYNLSDSNL